MLILLNQNTDFAIMYTENDTDLLSHEVIAKTSLVLEEQNALIASDLSDSELLGALSREEERQGSDGAASDEGSGAIEGQLAALLDETVVDSDKSEAFLYSLATGNVYFSGGADTTGGQTDAVLLWVQSLRSDHDSAISTTSLTSGVAPGSGSRHFVLSGRAVTQDGKIRGMLGVCMNTAVFSEAIESCFSEQGQQALFFNQAGDALFGAGGPADSLNVFSEFPATEELRSSLSADKTGRWRVWRGLEGITPHDQTLYDVCYAEPLDSYLLCVSTGATVFGKMRERSTTLLLTMGVISMLLILLIIAGVKWYRGRLIRVTSTDELTGLANRRSFAESYEQRFLQQDAGVISLVLVDADRFKQVNDTYGHAAGDEVLSAIATELQEAVGPEGLAGRWGGDEFVGVFRMPHDAARERAKLMIDRVASLKLTNDVKASVSLGMTQVDSALPLERMVEQADEALYVTKEGGRGFLTVYDADAVLRREHDDAEVAARPADLLAQDEAALEQEPLSVERDASVPREKEKLSSRSVVVLVMKSLLNAVRWMIPFVAGGGILVAVAFLFDAASVDMGSLSEDARGTFGSITPIAAGLHDIGLAAFNFMLPIFGAFFARGLAGNKAFVAGFAGGYLSSQGSAGFIGAILTAVIAAVVVRLLDNFLRGASDLVRRVASVLIIPVFSLLVMYLFMLAVIDPLTSVLDSALAGLLSSLASGNRTVLGAVLGAMMSTDLGGFVNKAAYHFGMASISAGAPDIMAAVMVGGMVPPCGIAVSMLLFRKKFTNDECDLAPTTFLLGLSFITEGAIPFAITDFARVIPSCMAGSALAGALSMTFGCTLMAPHGGIFVFPVVGNPVWYLVSLALGSLLCGFVLGLLKRPVTKDPGSSA